MFKRNAWHHISIAIRLYVLALLVFTLFRVILFLTETARVDETVSVKDILLAFVMGLRFDVVITGYILILPFLILSIIASTNQGVSGVLPAPKVSRMRAFRPFICKTDATISFRIPG